MNKNAKKQKVFREYQGRAIQWYEKKTGVDISEVRRWLKEQDAINAKKAAGAGGQHPAAAE